MNIILCIGLALFFTGMFLSFSSMPKYLEFTTCTQAEALGLKGKRFMTNRQRYELEQMIRQIAQDPSDPFHLRALALRRLNRKTTIIGFLGFFLIILGGFLQSVL